MEHERRNGYRCRIAVGRIASSILDGAVRLGLIPYLLRRRVYFFSFMTTMQAAIPAIAAAALLTLVMGVARQVPADKPAADLIGLSKMLNFWPFILVYFWMTMLVGEITIKQTARFSWRRLPAFHGADCPSSQAI